MRDVSAMRGLTHLRFNLSVLLSRCSSFILKACVQMIRKSLQSTKIRKQRTQAQIKLDEKLNQDELKGIMTNVLAAKCSV